MATHTIILANNENGNVRCEVDWDDQTNRLTQLRQINATTLGSDPRAIESKFNLVSDPTKRWPTDGTFFRTPAGQTDTIPIPPNVANSLPLTVVTLRGRLIVDNLNTESHFPVP